MTLESSPSPLTTFDLTLKRHNRAEIIKKSVILFLLLDRIEQKFFNFSAAHLPVERYIETTFPYFLF